MNSSRRCCIVKIADSGPGESVSAAAFLAIYAVVSLCILG